MNRKKARFDVVRIEITVHCPWCDASVKSPNWDTFIWNAKDIREALGRGVECGKCSAVCRLDRLLRELLKPSTEPVHLDHRVSAVHQIKAVCVDCDAETTLSTGLRCVTCGSDNVVVAAAPEVLDQLLKNGKDISDATASHTTTTETA